MPPPHLADDVWEENGGSKPVAYGIFLFLMTLGVLGATYYFLRTIWLTGKDISQNLRRPDNSKTIPPKQPPIPPPPSPSAPTAEDLRVLHAAAEGTLAIRHVFPPRHPRRSLSFLGGLPMAPADFEWPMALNPEGLLEWLPFVGQVNCADLPRQEQTAILPREGVLYFFLPTAGSVTAENQKLAVRYVSSRPSAIWEEHQGLALPPVNGRENARYQFAWMNWLPKPERSYPTSYPRIEIELGWVDYGGEVQPEDADAANGLPWEVKAQRHRKNLVSFHGEPVEHDPLLSTHGKPTDQVWRVHEGFPLSWQAIGVVGGHLRVFLQEQRSLLQQAQQAGENGTAAKIALPEGAENLPAVYDRLEARTQKLMSWIFRGVQEPGPEDKTEFWALLDSLLAPTRLPLLTKGGRWGGLSFLINGWLAQAAILSAEACLNDSEAAPRVPAEVVQALRERHSVLRSHMFKDKGWHIQHQMLGRGDVIQEAADTMAETHLLLLQLSSDDALGIQVGDNGAYQFWITPADLAARRFDQVQVTFECH